MVMSTRRFLPSSPRFGMSRSGRFPSSSSMAQKTVSRRSSTRKPAELASAFRSAWMASCLSVSEQELELCTRPQVARVGPIDDLVGSAATGSGQLVEGQSVPVVSGSTSGRSRSASIMNGLGVLGHGEQPSPRKGSIVTEGSCLVYGVSVGRHMLLELVHAIVSWTKLWRTVIAASSCPGSSAICRRC